MPVLVTGGTGFVGGAIVRRLHEQGAAVRVLARTTSETDHLQQLGVEVVRGDILDQSSIEAATRDCDTLYHAAAIYEFWTPDEVTLRRTQIEGTSKVLDAAFRSGIRRVIYTSTAVVVGERNGEVGTESTSHRGYFLTPYEKAKYEAEAVARSFREKGLPIIILKPAAVLGPGDLKPTGQALLNLLNGRTPMLFPGVLSTVSVEDVAKAHVRAAELERFGEDYILAERILTMREWAGIACRLAGVKTPPVGPLFAARSIAWICELSAHLTGHPPLLARATVRMTAHGFRVDGGKAARELGLRYESLEETLRKAIAWYWSHGLLKRKPACV